VTNKQTNKQTNKGLRGEVSFYTIHGK